MILAGSPDPSGQGEAFLFPATSLLTLSSTSVAQATGSAASIIVAGTILDPGTQESHVVSLNWGDGQTSAISLGVGVLRFSANHAYTSAAATPRIVTATVTDYLNGIALGGVNSSTVSVSVHDAPPVFSASDITVSSYSINEGDSITLAGQFQDIGGQAAHNVTISWGDGSPASQISIPPTGVSGTIMFGGPSLSHTYQDNPQAPATHFNIVVTITDTSNDVASASVPISVANVAPKFTNLSVTPNTPTIFEGTMVTLSGKVSDPGTLDSHTVYIDWGDGATEPSFQAYPLAAGVLSFTYVHPYAATLNKSMSTAYPLAVYVTDKDGGSTPTDTFTETVIHVAPQVTISEKPSQNFSTLSINLFSDVFEPGPNGAQGITYLWSLTYQGGNFFSGTTVTATTPTFTFQGNGSNFYTVKLTVKDNYGETGSTVADVITASTTSGVLTLAPILRAIPRSSSLTAAVTRSTPPTRRRPLRSIRPTTSTGVR